MADPTTNFGWDLPNNNADDDTWGLLLIDIFNDLDDKLWACLPRDGTRSMTGTLTFAPGSTLVPFAKFQDGSLLTTPQAHAVEWTGTDLHLTQQDGTRKQVAYIDSNSTGNAATASKWLTARTLTVDGDVSGSVAIDGSEDETLDLTLDGDAVKLVALPAGAVSAFAMSTAPAGWLECNGAAVSRTTYAALFSAIGTTFGVGNGSTTFNVPDLRGEFIRGHDDGRGIDSGRVFGSLQDDALQNITGNIGTVLPTTANGTTYTTSGAFATSTERSVYSGAGANAKDVTFDASRVARTSTETRPRNVALLFCIKT